ncbi:phage virion morphogenesis protein [Acinetobacter sp. ULE_I010]|uniref:phage virion morphogenesis protein n=1 Tax=Acinetobacter sp. ULE_I010 TaxID=3373065 RepID=UPI003AF9882C
MNMQELPKHIKPILESLSADERAKLSKNIGRDLRSKQSKRISTQKNTDGSTYQARKTKLRDRIKGKVRSKMFNKLKNLQYLKVMSSANSIEIGFIGRIARIARVHQFGLRDRVARNASQVKYAKRELIGLSTNDKQDIEKLLIKHIDLK